MCKHVAAVLYGVGARLDQKPELLFVLRGVDQSELLARAGGDLPLAKKAPAGAKVLDEGDVAAVFGLDMADAADPAARASAPAPSAPKRAQRRKAAEDRAAPVATTGKRSAAARGKTPVAGARKVIVMSKRKALTKPTRKPNRDAAGGGKTDRRKG
jgi:uncharacterized Zn finger protein